VQTDRFRYGGSKARQQPLVPDLFMGGVDSLIAPVFGIGQKVADVMQ
jgi:hypothetical protein